MENKKIQVLGSGCSTCKQFFNTVEKIVKELEIETKVEYIDDVAKMIEMGVMTSPVLAIDAKPVLSGAGHDEKEIRETLLKACFSSIEDEEEKKEEKQGGCVGCSCCGGGCC